VSIESQLFENMSQLDLFKKKKIINIVNHIDIYNDLQN